MPCTSAPPRAKTNMCARTTVTTLGEPSLIAKNAGRAVRLFGTELLTVWIDLDGLTSRTLAAAIRQTGSVLSWTQSPDGIVDVKGAFSPACAVCLLAPKVNELNRDITSTIRFLKISWNVVLSFAVRSRRMSLMTGPNFPDPSPLPSPEPTIPPVREPPDDPRLPRSPVIQPDDPAEPNQI